MVLEVRRQEHSWRGRQGARPNGEHGVVVGRRRPRQLRAGVLAWPAAVLDIGNSVVHFDLEESHQIDGARLMACNLGTIN